MTNIYIYILWSDNDNNGFDDYIYGIYANEKDAQVTFNQFKIENNIDEYDIDEINDIKEHTLIEGGSRYNNEENFYISRLKVNADIKKIYFLRINEDGGGGKYHNLDWLFVSDDIDQLCHRMYWHYDNEHNR